MTIGQRIRELRVEERLTQKALAEQTGIPLRTLINYENSGREPNAKNMATLERFFQVSGDYLRGNSNERRLEYKWDDPELMDTVRGSLLTLLQNLNKTTNTLLPKEQKLIFDILVELCHVLKLENQEARAASISLLQDVFTASTRFIDICLGAGQGIDASARLEKAKAAALSHVEYAIEEAQKILLL